MSIGAGRICEIHHCGVAENAECYFCLQDDNDRLRARIAELEAKLDYPVDIDLIIRTATAARLRWAWEMEYPCEGHTLQSWIATGLAALPGEGKE